MSPERSAGSRLLQLLDHLARPAPIRRGEAHALAGRAVEAVGAERGEPVERRQRAVERRRDVLDGERRERPGQPHQHLRLEALDVDLAEGGQPMRGDERVERRHRHALPLAPADRREAAASRDTWARHSGDSEATVGLAGSIASSASPGAAPAAAAMMTTRGSLP